MYSVIPGTVMEPVAAWSGPYGDGDHNGYQFTINGPGEESRPRTLYVGNLHDNVTEDLLLALFAQIGQVRGCKIIREPGNDPYAFVEFADYNSAATALGAMNRRLVMDKEMKVNWATSPGSMPKTDTSKHYHIFVGDLSPEIETHTLREAFAPFGEISDCRVVKDPQTLKSRGYGFVSFIKKSEAENAISSMNGTWLGSRNIRTGWATRKPPQSKGQDANAKPLSFDEVYNQSSPTNCTVYCGGVTQGLTEELMQKTFSPFGHIQEIRVFKDKGYAFIRFATKEAATHAIVSVHNTEIAGQTVKCSWGKESGDPNNLPVVGQNLLDGGMVSQLNGIYHNIWSKNGEPLASAQLPYQYPGQQMGYWYPQPYPQVQGQFLHGMQGYTYGQFGYQQGYMGVAGMGAAVPWQPGVGVPQPSPLTAQLAAAAQGALPQQPNMLTPGPYPMQQFQAQ